MFKECNEQLTLLGAITSFDTAFWKLAAKNAYTSKWNTAALYCIDKAIMSAEPKWFSVLGKLYYFRGKILMELIKHSSSIVFPTSFQIEKISEYPEFFNQPLAIPASYYRCLGPFFSFSLWIPS